MVVQVAGGWEKGASMNAQTTPPSDDFALSHFGSLIYAGFVDLIPIMPPGATLSPDSKIPPEKVGKIPGQYLGDNLWRGYVGFTSVVASQRLLNEWSTWPNAGAG